MKKLFSLLDLVMTPMKSNLAADYYESHYRGIYKGTFWPWKIKTEKWKFWSWNQDILVFEPLHVHFSSKWIKDGIKWKFATISTCRMFEHGLMVHTHATRRCQIGLTIILVRLDRLRLVLQNPIGWLSQVFVARFDFIGVITRHKSENNFFTPTLGSDGYGS